MANRYTFWTFVDAPPQSITDLYIDTNIVSEIYWGDGNLDAVIVGTNVISHTYAGLNYIEGHTESSSNNYLHHNYIRGSLQEFNKLI